MAEFKLNIAESIPGIIKPNKRFSLILGVFYIVFGFVYFWQENILFAFVWLALGISGITFSIINENNLKKFHITMNDISISYKLSYFKNVDIPWNSIALIQVLPIAVLFTLNDTKKEKLDLSKISYRDIKDVKSQILSAAEENNINIGK
ncbi:MAG: hypothetical protein CVV23_12995 [Ignavibacteriae bacterium HGW-Ignavibacteriae-2]|jgi:hypothetical protein|nr:hypothetical protein [Bacteroidota bacterium]PKL87916.1 MAG: hypothetical protein CVV23_12995 [Ignavibacteriae bacterium HGW-Ignavibacteriae-2]